MVGAAAAAATARTAAASADLGASSRCQQQRKRQRQRQQREHRLNRALAVSVLRRQAARDLLRCLWPGDRWAQQSERQHPTVNFAKETANVKDM